MKTMAIAFFATMMAAFGIAAVAQQQNPANPPSQNEPAGPGTMPGGRGMMSGGMGMMGMMHMMGEMQNHHQQMTVNMDKLMQSMSAIEAEKDPAALKAKLAAHRALLEQMRTQMMSEGGMMHQMMGSAGPQAPAK